MCRLVKGKAGEIKIEIETEIKSRNEGDVVRKGVYFITYRRRKKLGENYQ